MNSKLFKIVSISVLTFVALMSIINFSSQENSQLSVAKDAEFAANTNATCTKSGGNTIISRHGVTWTISGNKTCGVYANGDPWVVGPISITGITPTPTSGRNGTVVNPSLGRSQGFDSRISSRNSYEENFNVGNNLPLSISANNSVVSSISNSDDIEWGQVDTYVILTVVSSSPAEGSFRPAYISGDYSHPYNENNLNYDALAKVDRDTISGEPTLHSLEERFEKTWYEQDLSWTGRYMHTPSMGLRGYGKNMAIQTGDAGLLLNMNFSDSEKRDLLIKIVQYGIDIKGILDKGGTWYADGGHNIGRIMPLMIAAMTLDDSGMKNKLSGSSFKFQEFQQTFVVSQADVNRSRYTGDGRPRSPYRNSDIGIYEWGITHTSDPTKDGNNWDAYYRDIAGGVLQAPAVAAKLMGAQNIINHAPFFGYAKRHWEYRNSRNGYTYGGEFYRNDIPGFHSNFFGACFDSSNCSDVEPPTPTQVSAPSISPSTTTSTSDITVSISTSTSGATIRYTTDGSEPTSSSTQYTGPFILSGEGEHMVKAKGFKSDLDDSSTSTRTYEIYEPITGDYTTNSQFQSDTLQNAQTGTFTITYTATPVFDVVDAGFGLSDREVQAWNNMGIIVLFNQGGEIVARNGDNYENDYTIDYEARKPYEIEVEVDIPNKTYSVWVTPEGGTKRKIAEDYDFRSDFSFLGAQEFNRFGYVSTVGFPAGTAVADGALVIDDVTITDSENPEPPTEPPVTPILKTTLNITKPTNGNITGHGLNCGHLGNTCSVTLDRGTDVSLVGTPRSGYRASDWSATHAFLPFFSYCPFNDGDCEFELTEDEMTVTRAFVELEVEIPQHTLTVNNLALGGTITSSPSGINCGPQGSGTCSADFNEDTQVTLTATPNTGFSVNYWSQSCSGSSETCVLDITDDKSALIFFSQDEVLNNAPVLSSIGDKTVQEEETLSFTISATDIDEDSLTYSTSSLPTNASFNASTRVFTFNPSNTQEGEYDITFTVSDSELEDEETITVTVINLEEANFNNGDRVITSNIINVRTAGILTASTLSNTTLIGQNPANTTGTIVEGPTRNLDIVWYRVNFDTGYDGWVGQDRLTDTDLLADSDGDGVDNTQDKCPNTPTNIKIHVNQHGCPKPKSDDFNRGTNLDDIDYTQPIENLELGRLNTGKVRFLENVTLHPNSSVTQRLDLNELIKIEDRKVTINTDDAPQLNKRATIELEGLTYTTPVVKKDGTAIFCPLRADAQGDEECIIESYIGGTLTFTVSGFSTYEIEEGADTEGPTVTEVTAVDNPTDDSTPNYTFNTTEAGEIEYSGSCSSNDTNATQGNNTITFNSLDDGEYDNCTLTVTDSSDNESNTLDISTFEIDTSDDSSDSNSGGGGGGGGGSGGGSSDDDDQLDLRGFLEILFIFRLITLEQFNLVLALFS
jgi:hypothetical protein